MKPKIDYTLYLCTDRSQMSTPTLEEAVLSAIRGGCTLIQLREKDGSSREFYETAVRIKAVTDRAGIPLIVNDRVDIALAVDAAGVHIGQSDLPAASVRALLGPDKILGVSAARVDEAVRAVEEEAEYPSGEHGTAAGNPGGRAGPDRGNRRDRTGKRGKFSK